VAYSIISGFAQNLPFFATKTVNTNATDAPTIKEDAILTKQFRNHRRQ
jgi:hypothetical protein